jgi:hypothetical protein
MGILDKLFGKKKSNKTESNITDKETTTVQKGTVLISTGNQVAYEVIRPLTDELREKIEQSTILLRTGPLYMHYWTENIECPDREDQEWQNKVMFFWKAEEPFPKKSLPPHFETFQTKHFLFEGNISNISLQVAQAMPWFGMPGLGEKHVCKMNGEAVTIPELNALGLVAYLEPIELTKENLNILTEKEHYFFLIDERLTPFQNGQFYLNERSISISDAYSIGGIHIVRKIKLA